MTTPAGGRHRAAPPQRPAPSGSGRLRAASVVLGLLCIPALAAVIVFAVRSPSSAASSALAAKALTGTTSQAAEAAARRDVTQLLSYDYRTVAADIKAAQADTTGAFSTQYSTSASRLLSQAKSEKAIVSATVGSSGVVSAAGNDVVVLLFVDQASVREPAGQKSPTTRIDQSRVQMTMTLVAGKWLVSSLHAL